MNRVIPIKIQVESTHIHRVTGEPIQMTWFNRIFMRRNIMERVNPRHIEIYIPVF